jgi:hypothetical protein
MLLPTQQRFDSARMMKMAESSTNGANHFQIRLDSRHICENRHAFIGTQAIGNAQLAEDVRAETPLLRALTTTQHSRLLEHFARRTQMQGDHGLPRLVFIRLGQGAVDKVMGRGRFAAGCLRALSDMG